MFRSLKTKMLVFQMGLITSVIAALGVSTYLVMFNALEKSQRQNLEYRVGSIADQLNAVIEGKKELLKRIAGSEEIAKYVSTQQDTLLGSLFARHVSDFPLLAYANANGVEQFKLINRRVTDRLEDISDSGIFIDCSSHHNQVFCSYLPSDDVLHRPSLVFGYYGMNFFDEFTGFLKAASPVSDLARDLAETRFGQSGYMMLVDSEGAVLVCSGSDASADTKSLAGDGQAMEWIRAMVPGYGRGQIRGTDSYFVHTPVPGTQWSVVAVLPYSEFTATLRTLRNAVLLTGLMVLVAGSLVMLVMAHKIAEPLLVLARKSSSIARGDFSERMETASKDEIGTLAASFNYMAEELARTTTTLTSLNLEVEERRRVENALVKANMEFEAAVAKLTNANRELEEFAHIIAHDLKTPLRAIGSLAEMVAADYADRLDYKGVQLLAIMQNRVERMNRFITGVLRYSELGRPLKKQLVDMNEVIDEAFAEIALPPGCIVTKEGSFPTLLCNRMQMAEVFRQLIGNAAKYIDKPVGRIAIACRKGEGFWKFSIADNGRGIDERYIDKIFRIFQTLERRDEAESTGIGLSLVRKIIEMYDGKVWVESRSGEGSTFHFTLPMQQLEAQYEKLSANTAG